LPSLTVSLLRVRSGYERLLIQLVDPFSVLAGEQMPIGVHCNLNTAMARLLLNVFGMGTLSDKERNKRVPQVVEADPSDFVTVNLPVKSTS